MPSYEDFNNDGVINDQDRMLIGNANPDFFGGFSSEFRYRALVLNSLSSISMEMMW